MYAKKQHLITAALAMLMALAAVPALAAKKDYGQAPAGCHYGPRGGLHCPRYIKGPSEEGTTQREKRMRRECKGRPNAGACLGYAR